jgi:hypothetical protein
MSGSPDWEERCALALSELDRFDLDDRSKLAQARRILSGEGAAEEQIHDWVEIGMESMSDHEHGAPGERIQYRCQHCGAFGYRVVFPTSVTLYPVVTDATSCR